MCGRLFRVRPIIIPETLARLRALPNHKQVQMRLKVAPVELAEMRMIFMRPDITDRSSFIGRARRAAIVFARLVDVVC